MKKITQFLVLSFIIIFSAGTLKSQYYIDAFKIGSSQYDQASCCIEDSQGNIILSGNYEGTADFDPGSGEALLTGGNSYSGFIAKYEKDLSYIWAVSINGTDQINGMKIGVDATGNIYFAGYFRGLADFDPSVGEYLLEAEEMDGFLAKYDPDGNFVWAFKISSPESDIAFDVGLDNEGNIWVSGTFTAPIDFDPSENTFILNDHGFMDAFVANYSPDGSFIWAAGIGGESSLFYQPAITFDNAGSLYLSSQFSNQADLDPGTGTYIVESNGSSDMYLLKLDQDRNFEWGFSMGGEMQDQTRDVYFSNEHILITGFYESTMDFDPSSGEAILTSDGDYDAFIAAYGIDGAYSWVQPIVGTGYAEGLALAADDEHNVYVTGSFHGTSDFDPSSASFELTPQGAWDIFTAKYDESGNFLWANHAGGNENDYGQHIIIDDMQEKVMICGKFKGHAEFDFIGSGHLLSASGSFDVFLAAYTTREGAGVQDGNISINNIKIQPNPFNTSTTIEYTIQQPETVQLSVFNQLGQLVYQHSEDQQQGTQQLQWDAQDQSEGLYNYQLHAGDQVATGKLVKMR